MAHLECFSFRIHSPTLSVLLCLKIVILLTLSGLLVFYGDKTNFIPKIQLWTEREALPSFSNSFPFGAKLLLWI